MGSTNNTEGTNIIETSNASATVARTLIGDTGVVATVAMDTDISNTSRTMFEGTGNEVTVADTTEDASKQASNYDTTENVTEASQGDVPEVDTTVGQDVSAKDVHVTIDEHEVDTVANE
jgi:cysteine synthase